MNRKRVAVDFDGVLASTSGWVGHDHYGEVIPEGRELCRELRARGYEIVILTSRMCEEFTSKFKLPSVKTGLSQWLSENDVPFDYVWDGHGKPSCVAYFDDRAIAFDPQAEPHSALTLALSRLDRLVERPI